MIIEGNKIIADEGKVLYRKADDWCGGKEVVLGYIYYINEKAVDPPHLEVPEDYYELDQAGVEKKRKDYYASGVEPRIRERYSLSQELATQRQRDSKPQEFKEYFDYCELCKKIARRVAEMKYPDIENYSSIQV